MTRKQQQEEGEAFGCARKGRSLQSCSRSEPGGRVGQGLGAGALHPLAAQGVPWAVHALGGVVHEAWEHCLLFQLLLPLLGPPPGWGACSPGAGGAEVPCSASHGGGARVHRGVIRELCIRVTCLCSCRVPKRPPGFPGSLPPRSSCSTLQALRAPRSASSRRWQTPSPAAVARCPEGDLCHRRGFWVRMHAGGLPGDLGVLHGGVHRA